MKRSLLFLTGCILTLNVSAQQVRPDNSAKIYNDIARLNNLTNVLYFAAHPDDENTRLLAWLVNDQHLRTAYLSLTRGDGGQNILGSEQGAALGLIRTHELLEARKLDGAEQFFTRAIDFGFSKNYTETFKHWDKDQLTSDAVRIIRQFRPDVIICRFPPNEQAGHGQHAASAIIAEDAFKAAGDPKQYADGFAAWQPRRILWNTFRFGSFNTTDESQLKLITGQYIPQLGMSTGELAGLSRSVHKSQGAGTPSVPGVQTEYFKPVDGEQAKNSLFDGLDISWNRVGRKDIGDKVNSVLQKFDFKHPEASLTALISIRNEIKTVTDQYWRNRKLDEINEIILSCSGIMAEIYTNVPEAITGSSLPFTLNVISRSSLPVKISSVQYPDTRIELNRGISSDSIITFNQVIKIPLTTPVSEPYWLKKDPENAGQFSIPADSLIGRPESPASLQAILFLRIANEDFSLPVPLSYKKLDPLKGDVVEPLRIVPAAALEFTQALLINDRAHANDLSVHVHPFKDFDQASVTLSLNNKQLIKTSSFPLKAGADSIITIHLKPGTLPADGTSASYIEAKLETPQATYGSAQHIIHYDHIPTLQYFTDAKAKILNTNWKYTVKRIGYISGAGDYIADFLKLAGLNVDVLKDADFIDPAKLSVYDAIITGVRAVNIEKRMKYWMPVLNEYIKNGGTVIMQYNTLQDLSTTQIGPYPFTISNNRVTEEDAEVKFLDPKERLLNYPNKITQTDFKGWTQELGTYFPANWDQRYHSVLEMNDTGEKPLQSSLLYAKYGKGVFIYSSLALFRQLPAGNSGAIRLLMNMISANH
ncbi:PIG-L family deacetylase [Pedobacter sp. HMF7647]|uniref:PIG-L family deacetylase n=1 Tax=Hufsiella arboris TaxID=2695275 RepID=A0A7K1Y997_9SPHI|nr:PIG-L family deacetylase [Hufsiella arboris]MXV51166.1 PIG-L family deacetylase [Hufsiella arboris]